MSPIETKIRGNRRNYPRMTLKSYLGSGDSLLLLVTMSLTLFGLVMVYSASLFLSLEKQGVNWYFLSRQSGLLVVGLGMLYLGMRVEVDSYRRWVKLVLLFFVLLMATQALFGPVHSNTRRWLKIAGVTFQTSEAARCAAILYMARIFADDEQLAGRLSKKLVLLLLPVFALIVLTYAQRDFSSAVMMAMVVGVMLILAGMNWKLLIGGGGLGLLGAVAFVLRTPYQRERLLTFMFPSRALSEDNYQSYQSMLGFGRGGFLGVGLGEGKQKMLFLPEPHTDFIFSIIGEEFGLLGSGAVLFAFLVLVWRATRMLADHPDRFGFFLGSGLIFSIGCFALVHMAVTTGILPVTGLPLPFISSGGTSLVVSLWSIGVLWNLSRRTGWYRR